jgi:hypothetical protein
MTIRFIGPLLCGGLLLIATSALARDPAPVAKSSEPASMDMMGLLLGTKANTGAAKKGASSGATDGGAPTKGKSLINTTHSNIRHPSVNARAAPSEDRIRMNR